MSRRLFCSAASLLLLCTLSLCAFTGCGGGSTALPGAAGAGNTAPENENQGSIDEPLSGGSEQAPPGAEDGTQQSPDPGPEQQDGSQQYGQGIVAGIHDGDATIIPNGRIPLKVGENLIDHWNYASANAHIIEKNENFAGRELYMQVGAVEYEFTGLQDHWVIEAVEVKGFGHIVAGLWSSEFGYYWEGPTMYLDQQPTSTTFFFYDHIEDGGAKLMLHTWAYADEIDASIYEVRVFVKNNAVLQSVGDNDTGIGPLE